MNYKLGFHPDALAEWRKLDASVSEQFKKKLAERLQHPHVPAARLAGHKDRYKIKLRSVGYRLSLIHISEPTRRTPISYAVFCLKKKKKKKKKK